MKYDLKFKNKKKGFTLIELLIVISIIGILTIISVASFKNAQIKARDAQRKSDLDAVSKSLMMYFNDKGEFPGIYPFDDDFDGFRTDEIIYMRKTPRDPINTGEYQYIYKVDPSEAKFFNLYANLENKNDNQCLEVPYEVDGSRYCYGISSPNTVVDPNQF